MSLRGIIERRKRGSRVESVIEEVSGKKIWFVDGFCKFSSNFHSEV